MDDGELKANCGPEVSFSPSCLLGKMASLHRVRLRSRMDANRFLMKKKENPPMSTSSPITRPAMDPAGMPPEALAAPETLGTPLAGTLMTWVGVGSGATDGAMGVGVEKVEVEEEETAGTAAPVGPVTTVLVRVTGPLKGKAEAGAGALLAGSVSITEIWGDRLALARSAWRRLGETLCIVRFCA